MTGRLPGRGARITPANRFTRLEVAPDREQAGHGRDGERPDPRTLYLKDASRQVIATNDSPDVGFDASINPYRGCECGCAYRYSRPFHEYLGFSAGVDFETRILVKDRAAELLRAELSSPRWQPRWLALSGVSDPYQPVERELRVTRGVLEVLAEFRNPVGIVTKNHLVTRDLDLLQELAAHDAVAVSLSITTLDADLQRRMEPRASSPDRRLAAVATLAGAGVPVGVITAPLIPGLNDQEIPRILEAA